MSVSPDMFLRVGNALKCTACGRSWRTAADRVAHACTAAKVEIGSGDAYRMPGTVKLATRYGKAVARWIAAGRPTRSQDEIDALLAICQTCRQYNAEYAACAKCGCSVNSQASGLANKLAMATEHCPLGKW